MPEKAGAIIRTVSRIIFEGRPAKAATTPEF
jgi:hypothetical protein